MKNSNKEVVRLNVGQRVKHNYQDGHGLGTIVSVDEDHTKRFAYRVKYDNVDEVMPYSYNEDNKEIIPVGK